MIDKHASQAAFYMGNINLRRGFPTCSIHTLGEGIKSVRAVGMTFSWRKHFGSCLAWKFETLGVSSVWDIHGTAPCTQGHI